MDTPRLLQHTDLAEFTDVPLPTAMRAAARLITRLMTDPKFPNLHDLSRYEQTPDNGPVVAHSFDAGPFIVQLFAWPPHAQSQIHDHSSWGAIGCLIGEIREERYRRLDNGTQLNVAHLKKIWQRTWQRATGVSTLLPGDGGIHRISNLGDTVALSVHIYGPPSEIDGRDYDPSRNYVCDRME